MSVLFTNGGQNRKMDIKSEGVYHLILVQCILASENAKDSVGGHGL